MYNRALAKLDVQKAQIAEELEITKQQWDKICNLLLALCKNSGENTKAQKLTEHANALAQLNPKKPEENKLYLKKIDALAHFIQKELADFFKIDDGLKSALEEVTTIRLIESLYKEARISALLSKTSPPLNTSYVDMLPFIEIAKKEKIGARFNEEDKNKIAYFYALWKKNKPLLEIRKYKEVKSLIERLIQKNEKFSVKTVSELKSADYLSENEVAALKFIEKNARALLNRKREIYIDSAYNSLIEIINNEENQKSYVAASFITPEIRSFEKDFGSLLFRILKNENLSNFQMNKSSYKDELKFLEKKYHMIKKYMEKNFNPLHESLRKEAKKQGKNNSESVTLENNIVPNNGLRTMLADLEPLPNTPISGFFNDSKNLKDKDEQVKQTEPDLSSLALKLF